MTLIELPRRRAAPRVFVEPEPDLSRRVARALSALGDLPEGFDLPGLDDLAAALIDIADELGGDTDLEPDPDDEPEEDRDECDLPLFVHAGRASPP